MSNLWETLYLGEPMEFWTELREKADVLEVTYLIRENAMMRSKVHYFEEMLRKANAFTSREK